MQNPNPNPVTQPGNTNPGSPPNTLASFNTRIIFSCLALAPCLFIFPLLHGLPNPFISMMLTLHPHDHTTSPTIRPVFPSTAQPTYDPTNHPTFSPTRDPRPKKGIFFLTLDPRNPHMASIYGWQEEGITGIVMPKNKKLRGCLDFSPGQVNDEGCLRGMPRAIKNDAKCRTYVNENTPKVGACTSSTSFQRLRGNAPRTNGSQPLIPITNTV